MLLEIETYGMDSVFAVCYLTIMGCAADLCHCMFSPALELARLTCWNLFAVNLQQVRMPEGDTVVLDDTEPTSSSGSSGQQYGEVVDAEFRDLK
jgi:hypothetical protein